MKNYIGKLVKGSNDDGNGLVTASEKVKNPEYITHIIKVTYPKTGAKEIKYILSEKGIPYATQNIEFIE